MKFPRKPSKYTPTQERILNLLSDGLPHTRAEIQSLLPDSLSALAAIRKHICYLRKHLPPDQRIICEVTNGRKAHYCLMQLVGKAREDALANHAARLKAVQ